MAITINHLYSTHVMVTFYAEDGTTLRSNDVGTMDDIAEQACEILVKHNFESADVCSAETGELLITIERT